MFKQFTEEQLTALIEAAVVKDYPENYTVLDRETRTRVRYTTATAMSCFVSAPLHLLFVQSLEC